MKSIYHTQADMPDTGRLQVSVESRVNRDPIPDARIAVSYTGEPDSVFEELSTNESGRTEQIDLEAPALEYSMEPSETQPYAQYTVQITAEGYQPVTVNGVQVLSDQTAVQDIRLQPIGAAATWPNDIVIPANALFGNFPPKIEEAEIKPVRQTGEIVLSRVVVPEYVIVHDGVPTDNTATDYYIRYRDYIKNVASSEIYATWPDATIRANILAILSFTMNRVYTEWYRNKGYNFTITSSTAFDQKWSYGRNIFSNISLIVDEMFQNFLSRPNVRQPILTQYCDGQRVSCPNWMTQWGSKYLGDGSVIIGLKGYQKVYFLIAFFTTTIYHKTAIKATFFFDFHCFLHNICQNCRKKPDK